MRTNEQCLPADLQTWLLNPNSDSEAEKWSQHLEHCPQCRSRIEEQPTALAWPKILNEDAWDHELSSSPEIAIKPRPLSGIDQASLVKFARQVIDKSDNPAMLGRLGEFEILEPIGMGGMSLVLKGYDHELNRFVAIIPTLGEELPALITAEITKQIERLSSLNGKEKEEALQFIQTQFDNRIQLRKTVAEEKLKLVQGKLERLTELSKRMNKKDLEEVGKLLREKPPRQDKQGNPPGQDSVEEDPFKDPSK